MSIDPRTYRLLRRLHEQKAKWYQKEQSYDALFTITDRMLQVQPQLMRMSAELNILATLFMLSWSFDFSFDISKVPVFSLDWEIQVPSLDELLKGILIKTRKLSAIEVFYNFMRDIYGVDLLEHYNVPSLDYLRFDLKLFSDWLLQPSYSRVVLGSTLIPGVYSAILPCLYGYGRYGENTYWHPYDRNASFYGISYYQYPEAEKVLAANVAKRGAGVGTDIELFGADVAEHARIGAVVKFLLLDSAIRDSAVCGAFICGVSRVPVPKTIGGEEWYEIKARSPVLGEIVAYVKTVDHILWGPICGVTPCGYFRLPPINESMLSDKAFEFPRYMVERNVARIASPTTAMLVAEPGARTVYESTRAHIYAEKQVLRYQVEAIVRRALADKPLDPIKLNSYVSFALDFVFSRARRHAWTEAFASLLPQDKYEEFIIRKWVRMGLDEKLLRELAEVLRTWCRSWQSRQQLLSRLSPSP